MLVSMEMLNPVRYIWRSTRWAANCAVADRLAVSWANLRRASAQQRAGAGANRHYKLVSRVRAEVHVSVLWIALCSHRRFPDHAGRQMPSVTDRTERACDSGQNARLATLRSQCSAMIALCSHRRFPGHAGRQMPSVTGRTECACDSCQNAWLTALRSQCKSFPVNRHNLHNCSNICHKSFTGKR